MSIDQLNADNALGDGDSLTIGNGGIPLDLGANCSSPAASDATAMSRVMNAASEAGVVALVGVACTSTMQAVAAPLAAASVPTVSYSLTDAHFANSTAYPFFVRNTLTEQMLGHAMANLALSLGWTRVGVLHQVRAVLAGETCAVRLTQTSVTGAALNLIVLF